MIHFHFLDFVLTRETFSFHPPVVCIKHYDVYKPIDNILMLLRWMIFTGALHTKGSFGQKMCERTLKVGKKVNKMRRG